MSDVSSAIELRNVNVRFGERQIIHDLSFTFKAGEFVSIVGRSGCGKSTLLNAMAGFVPSAGSIQIPANFGFIFQSYAAFPWLTVRENVLFGMPENLQKQQRLERLASLLSTTDLTDEAAKYPAELSGGQVQRVAFARAFARDPEVLLMDEPFGALDTYTREKMQTWLLQWCMKRTQTVLFVTHSIEEAIFLSDRVVILADGAFQAVFDVPFDRPRDRTLQYESKFIEMKRTIADILEGTQSNEHSG